MSGKLHGEKVLVTGGSSGIGNEALLIQADAGTLSGIDGGMSLM